MFFAQVALQMGWDHVEPTIPGRPYDCMICTTPEAESAHRHVWEKVQVKRAYPKAGTGALTVNMTRSGSGEKYAEDDADWLAAVDVLTQQVWLIPWTFVVKKGRPAVFKKTRITVTEEYSKFILEVPA